MNSFRKFWHSSFIEKLFAIMFLIITLIIALSLVVGIVSLHSISLQYLWNWFVWPILGGKPISFLNSIGLLIVVRFFQVKYSSLKELKMYFKEKEEDESKEVREDFKLNMMILTNMALTPLLALLMGFIIKCMIGF